VLSQERSKGRFNKARGKVKEELGRAVDDRSTEWSGKLNQVRGSFQERIGQAKLDTRRFADGLRTR
jgi:uncharacterized protein YjbJ (UPF0337 family)